MTITLRGLAVIAALALSAPFPAAAGGNTKIEFCHATGSESNPYVLIETSTAAFYNSGHVDHEGDIYPAGSHGEQSWPARGDQSILAAGCVVTPPTEEPTPTPTPTPTATPTPTETPSTPTPTTPTETPVLPTPTLPTPTVTETVTPPAPTVTPSATATVPPPSTPVETPSQEPTKTPTREPEVSSQVKTEHAYSCTSHTAIRYERTGSGPWVEISREVRTYPNTCAEGETALQAIREEGL